MGHIPDPDKLPELMILWTPRLLVRGSDAYMADDPETLALEISKFEQVAAPSLDHLQSVVLII
jgi:hypothetical protein